MTGVTMTGVQISNPSGTPTVATPSASPGAGTYSSAQSVTLTTATGGAAIYYTTDGSTPTTSSTLYSGAISISVTTTLKAIAALAGYNNSSVLTAAYTITAGTYPVTVPGGATAYTSIEQTSGWTAEADSSISPNPPCAYAIVPNGGGGSTMTLQTTPCSGLWTGWMAKKGESSTSGQYNMVLRATYEFDSVTDLQAWEVGRRATDNNGITDNGQTQLVPISGGQLEFDIVPSSSGGWQDTGCRFSMFTTNTLYSEELYYIRDTNGALSLMYVELNGTVCTIPSTYGGVPLQHIAGASLHWTPNEFVAAFQPDAKPGTTPYNATVTMTLYMW